MKTCCTKYIAFLTGVVALTVMTACSAKPADQKASPEAQASASHAVEPAAPASMAAGESVQGQVMEKIDAPGYVYLRVKSDKGEIWAATLPFKVAVGDTVVVPLENPMPNFASPTLKRTFDMIYFASAITKPGEAPSGAAGALPPGHPTVGGAPGGASAAAPAMGAPVPDAKLIDPVPPVSGGTSVAKVWADRKALSGKTVTVRGKVVKYNGNVMGLNWIHLQDGSGSPTEGTHDLTITSTMETKVGDVVTITGTVVTDKDFTAGYKYAVMLQGARIK
jgi:hypothetical protein